MLSMLCSSTSITIHLDRNFVRVACHQGSPEGFGSGDPNSAKAYPNLVKFRKQECPVLDDLACFRVKNVRIAVRIQKVLQS